MLRDKTARDEELAPWAKQLRVITRRASERVITKAFELSRKRDKGAPLDGKRRVFILDIVGAGENTDGLRLDLGASAGKISNISLVSNGAMHGLRASFEVDPNNADLIEMRLRILRGDVPITETWLYRWTSI